MLSFNLAPVFRARGIDNPYRFLVKAGIAPPTANRIAYNKPRILRLDHIELLCRLLFCEPNDLLAWTPDKGQVLPNDHPLQNLQYQSDGNSLNETIATMPYRQLKEVAKTINEITKTEK